MTEYAYKTFTGKGADNTPSFYHMKKRDALLVDMAIKLGRPLLVEGEAGCGKTTLATAIADELGLGDPIIVPIRSTSRANDLFYRTDKLAQLRHSNIESKRDLAERIQNYVQLEPIGKAIVNGEAKVILIDEIDKADMDLQNDLLFALERFEFVIDDIPARESETLNGVKHHMKRTGGAKPIIIFTSNQEKLLPKPFLRRCLYLELGFPDTPEELIRIVEDNLEKRVRDDEPGAVALSTINQTIVRQAVESFIDIRIAADQDGAIKKPATSELLDWVHAMHIHPELATDVSGKTPALWEMLFRTSQDRTRHARHVPSEKPDQTSA